MNINKYIRISLWILIIIGISLIIIHGLIPNIFLVDGITILILFILSIPYLAFFLRKAKIAGAEFEFKDEISKTEELVKKSVEVAEIKKLASQETSKEKIKFFETFNTEPIKKLLDSDTVLALAALRIEIEKKVKNTAKILDFNMYDRLPISKFMEIFEKMEILSKEQTIAIRKIINMCNKAIHGEVISNDEAREIINITDELNKSFSTGYSIDFKENLEYEKNGLFCKWEHCIERMPLSKKRTEFSCPVFGHNCPGGLVEIKKCGKKISDIPKERFVKNK
jgi:hypothetical protein